MNVMPGTKAPLAARTAALNLMKLAQRASRQAGKQAGKDLVLTLPRA